ncbi:dihydroorotase [Risungbinella massiliensis]|uniref:dihydroorotase n=1 Tax=Risungbinella massiliensis TaxID=1329796 RepID=UPI0005CC2F63|nr:dihydroorotase [Risungbinella massiliensis]
MKRILKNGSMFVERELVQRDILIDGDQIVEISEEIVAEDAQVIDLTGKFVSAGFIDMHVHLREPGFEKKETIETGSRSAAKGGFTTIACMPNTRPVTDSPEVVERIYQAADKAGYARVLPLGAITVRELGRELTDFAALQNSGIVALSDDGVGVQSSYMMKQAMRKAHELGLAVVAHCEDDTLVQKGCVHDGEFAKKHNLPGIPSECEAIHVGRDILLAEDIGVHYHVCHISAEQSVRLVREAKSRGQKVTAEVTPHHLLLSDADIPAPEGNWKMNPPLRSPKDRQALIEGLKDGTIDIIATDHAPHTAEEKAMSMEEAPFGIVGLETAFPLLYTHLVETGELTLYELVDKMTRKPAELFGLSYGTLEEGQVADIVVLDLDKEQEIDPDTFVSKGKNTPFGGWKVKGWPIMTFYRGLITWNDLV